MCALIEVQGSRLCAVATRSASAMDPKGIQRKGGRSPSERCSDALQMASDLEEALVAHCNNQSFVGWHFGMYSGTFDTNRGKAPNLEIISANFALLSVLLRHYASGKILNDEVQRAFSSGTTTVAAANPNATDVVVLSKFLTAMHHRMCSHIKDLVKFESRFRFRIDRAPPFVKTRVAKLMAMIDLDCKNDQRAAESQPVARQNSSAIECSHTTVASTTESAITMDTAQADPAIDLQPIDLTPIFMKYRSAPLEFRPENDQDASEETPPRHLTIPACFLEQGENDVESDAGIIGNLKAIPQILSTGSKRKHGDNETEAIDDDDLLEAARSVKPVPAARGAQKAKAIAAKEKRATRIKLETMVCSLGEIRITCRHSGKPEANICTKEPGQSKWKCVVTCTESRASNYMEIIESAAKEMATNDWTKEQTVQFVKSTL